MKKKSVKVEYIVLAIIIVGLSLYLILRNPNKVQYEIPDLETIGVEDITKIEILKPGETIVVVQKDDKWTIDPEGYPVAGDRIKEITDAVKNLKLDTLASQSKNYVPYGLDKLNRILVKVMKGEELLREFAIGKVPSTYRHTYVRLKDDDRVFHARNAFRNYFNKKVDDLRDKQVISFDQNEISEMKIDWKSESLGFVKNVKPVEVKVEADKEKGKDKEEGSEQEQAGAAAATEEVVWVNRDYPGKKVQKNTVTDLIRDLSSLSCQKYDYDKKKEDYVDPIYTVTLKGAKDYSLSIFKKIEEEGGSYPAITSENPYAFFLTTYKAEDLMKKTDDFFEKQESPDKKDK